MDKLMLLSLVLVFMGSCSFQTNDSNTQSLKGYCIATEKSMARKAQLENGIREQVKFLEEPENLSSIANRMSKYNIPAVSLAVIDKGEIEWADIYKNVDFPAVQNLNCSSIFQAASLSKPVTFLAALRMHAAGEINLDKNIQDYLKEYVLPPGKQTVDNPVTFRNIFSHTSGITPGGYQGYARSLQMPSDIDIVRGSVGVNSSAIAVIAVPNETLAYSGGGYTLAELALQDIYSNSFTNIMQKWILEPTGMNNSSFIQPLPNSDSNRVAKAYNASGEVLEGGWKNYPEQAAAGLWSNSIDMAKFLIEIYNAYQGKSSIFSQSEIKSIVNNERDGHVYGFIVNRTNDEITLTHYGGNAGYRTGITINLATGNGLAYLINSDNGAPLGNELFLTASQVYNWKNFKQTEVKRKQVSSEVLIALSGKYKWNNQIDVSITFDENSNQISLFFPNGDAYKLVPIEGDELDFIHPNTGVQISFIKKDDLQSFKLYGHTAVKL